MLFNQQSVIDNKGIVRVSYLAGDGYISHTIFTMKPKKIWYILGIEYVFKPKMLRIQNQHFLLFDLVLKNSVQRPELINLAR